VTPDIGHYCNCMLLDDVGNSVSSTDETTNCSYFERYGVMRYKKCICNRLETCLLIVEQIGRVKNKYLGYAMRRILSVSELYVIFIIAD
ncbi:Hypothetical predicted protein, partial [Olea europaea subsp. europaea]